MKPSVPARSRITAAALVACLFGIAPAAQAHKDDYLADTFVFVTLDRGEFEAEYWLDWRSEPRGLLHTAGFEYGLTDHLMADVSLRYAQPTSGAAHLETDFVELRYRFGDEGERPVDVAASIEYEERRGDRHRDRLLEPRLVLSHDFGGWNTTLNLVATTTLDAPRRTRLEWAAGLRGPSRGAFSAGVELQREYALENASTVVPQAWYQLGPDTVLKAGAGYNLAAEHDRFVRLVLESEF